MHAGHHTRPPQQRPKVAPDRWPEVAARAEHESLRDLAAVYSVSHETIPVVTPARRAG